MVKKLKKEEAGDAKSNAQLSNTVKESAQQIWLAGLGAFSKAQEEGGKVFETLVKEGVAIQRKTQTVAEEKLTEATSRMASMATDLSSRASGQWDKLETIFEERVARALGKLGVPSARDIDALVARIDELNRTVSTLGGGQRGTTASKAAGGKSTAGKSTAGKSAAAKSAAGKAAARKRPAARKGTQ